MLGAKLYEQDEKFLRKLGSHYDQLRGYDDYNLGFGGTVPLLRKFKYWVSGQYTTYDNYRVYHFDSTAYIQDDPGNIENKKNLLQPWDAVKGFRGFGFDKTWDVFGKLDLDYKDYVGVDQKYMRPEELEYLKGDSTEIREKLGWNPEYTFEQMLDEMIDYWLKYYNN